MILYHPLCSRITGSNNVLPEETRMNQSRFLEFIFLDTGTKTRVWLVKSKRHGNDLGLIKWFSRWRQYAFFPDAETVWNPECLRDICDLICGLMDDRKKGKLR